MAIDPLPAFANAFAAEALAGRCIVAGFTA
jgi:hypothetical protein